MKKQATPPALKLDWSGDLEGLRRLKTQKQEELALLREQYKEQSHTPTYRNIRKIHSMRRGINLLSQLLKQIDATLKGYEE